MSKRSASLDLNIGHEACFDLSLRQRQGLQNPLPSGYGIGGLTRS
jgi:hypothetical protein